MGDISTSVNIESLRELQKALRQADSGLADKLRRQLKGAAEIVAKDAASRVPSRTGRAAGSIRAGSTLKGAYVAGGKSSVRYYGWLDFGSRKPVQGNPVSVGPWAKSGIGPRKGRFIYPALADKFNEVRDAAEAAVGAAIRGAGLD